MRVLLSTIGSRGDAQPLVALGLELQSLGQRAKLVVAPNFKEWVESYGLECIPIGPDVRNMPKPSAASKPVPPSPEQLQALADGMVRGQFQVLGEAARDCDLVVAASALQIATRSVAEARGIPYVFAAYCPAVLPSSKYPPPSHGSAARKTGGHHPHGLPEAENERLWEENECEFQERFGVPLNEERANFGLPPVTSVQRHMFTDHPWLAADPALAPAFPLPGMEVVQTGAWVILDQRSLPKELETFLAAGAPPVYLGLGSTQVPETTGRMLVEAARTLGLRSVLSQGWAELTPGDLGDDCLSIGNVNYDALFPSVAAVVHHGGAGTTAATARAGKAQVILPHLYDQFYWAQRVQELGIGMTGPLRDELSIETLVPALRAALQPEVTVNAQVLAGRMELHGARLAAGRLTQEYGLL